MSMDRIKEILGLDRDSDRSTESGEKIPDVVLLNDEQLEEREHAISVLDDDEGVVEKKARQKAEQTATTAAEETLKRLHMIQLGRCPQCGSRLHRHLFASVCDACGWHDYEVPRQGPVRVWVRNRPDPIEGERCYLVKPNAILVLKNDCVVAWVNRDLVAMIEYVWTPEEIDMRHRQILDRITLLCGWCNKECDPEQDGFHVVQIAFGSTQERYTFCSDACYEAFRKMYPARVDRNCYERSCRDCNLCIKRYDDDGEGMRLLAKDYLRPRDRKA